MMTPVLFFQLITGIIGALQVFTQAFIMTAGGPNNATLFFLLYLYQNAFQYFRMGYGGAGLGALHIHSDLDVDCPAVVEYVGLL
ncbi:MAG: hypothetical protein R3E79_22085 [Caldilineaceae bacterium]